MVDFEMDNRAPSPHTCNAAEVEVLLMHLTRMPDNDTSVQPKPALQEILPLAWCRIVREEFELPTTVREHGNQERVHSSS